jgi:tetratricopeptide (TPR) repeat protein
MSNVAKPGRNDSCPCGSGRKFKRCCGASRPPPGPGAPAPGSAQGILQLAERLLKEGRFEAAIGPLEQATRLMPDNAALFNDLGMTCLLARRLPDAIGYLRRAIALRPGFARTHYNLGLALDRAGDGRAALAALHSAVLLAPELAEAHALAGDLLLSTGQRAEAASAYERASAASPATTPGRLCAAKALVLRDRHAEAEERLRQLIARDGSCAEAHLVLGHVLTDSGRFDESAASFERTLALDPCSAPAYHGLVSSRRLTEADWPLVARITARLDAADHSAHQRMTLHFAAGKALHDLKSYPVAIEHFDAANRIRRQLAPFDRRDFERRIDRLIARFTRDFFEDHAGLGAAEETPVLVLGMPRSGTTLIERIVSSHPGVAGGGELPFWRERGGEWVEAEPANLAGVADGLRADYLRLLRGIGPDALRVTDKMPFNFLWVGLVHALFPRARIIHCRRNPVDTCLSIYQTQFSQNWAFASERGDLAAYYRQYLRLMDHWRAVLPSDRLLEIDYEEATAAPEATARRLIAFCGLAWDAACLEPERNPDAVKTASKWQARQPIYRTSVERWRHYEPWIGELRELLPQSQQQG